MPSAMRAVICELMDRRTPVLADRVRYALACRVRSGAEAKYGAGHAGRRGPFSGSSPSRARAGRRRHRSSSPRRSGWRSRRSSCSSSADGSVRSRQELLSTVLLVGVESVDVGKGMLDQADHAQRAWRVVPVERRGGQHEGVRDRVRACFAGPLSPRPARIVPVAIKFSSARDMRIAIFADHTLQTAYRLVELVRAGAREPVLNPSPHQFHGSVLGLTRAADWEPPLDVTGGKAILLDARGVPIFNSMTALLRADHKSVSAELVRAAGLDVPSLWLLEPGHSLPRGTGAVVVKPSRGRKPLASRSLPSAPTPKSTWGEVGSPKWSKRSPRPLMAGCCHERAGDQGLHEALRLARNQHLAVRAGTTIWS